jgi:hypothetical protein
LDVHWKTASIHILDENGKKVKAMTIRGGWDKMLAVLTELPRPWSVCDEASCGYGVLMPRSLWSGKGRAWLESVTLPNRSARIRQDILLDDLQVADDKIARVTAELDAIADGGAAVTVLRTIPGIGPRTAEAKRTIDEKTLA